ncbi:MAG: hypothetical protein KKD38_04605 [Candidatus Delongbacteria bacterium]|nr:hypothetical protein [Candidatus Delongbacteria bacterium]MCG2760185.1 hypothetical protein [Candidatus Delongbacteria bacterium]
MEDYIIIDGVKYFTSPTKKSLLSMSSVSKLKKNEIRAFIPGQILKVFVKKGKKVKANKNLLTFEAMKMINEVSVESDIIIEEVFVKAGDAVEKNQLLIKYKLKPKK